MLATGKHFPGHGDTETNSHLSLSTVTASRARLDSVELVPFRAAIDAGVAAMMTYHGILPALDSSGVPATLSSKVLGGVLRQELYFRGLVVTDAMDMMGVVQQFGANEAAKRAVAAGADILLMPSDVPATIDAVVAGVREGRYDERRLDESVRRILVLKQRFGLDRQRYVALDSVRSRVGTAEHAAVARTVADRAVVLVKDSLQQVPLRRGATRKILAITYARRADLGAGVTFASELRRLLVPPKAAGDSPYAQGTEVDPVRAEFVSADDERPDFTRLLRGADSADVTIVSSYVNIGSTTAVAGAPGAFVDFVHELTARGRKPIIVAMGSPYLLQQVPEVPAYLIAWGPSGASQGAAARALLGAIPITAKLPIRIPPFAPMGAGVIRRPSSD
jgi:beta-N-acetylhexosaminidase